MAYNKPKTSARPRAHCFYHDELEDYRTAVSTLRSLVGIPKSLRRGMAMTICSCRRRPYHRTPTVELHGLDEKEPLGDTQLLHELSRRLQEKTKTKASSATNNAVAIDFVSRAIFEKDHGSNESALRLILVLKMATGNSFRLLQEEKLYDDKCQENKKLCTSYYSDNKESDDVINSLSSANRPAKVNISRLLSYILKKRKRQADGMYKCVLPMFAGSMRRLFEDKAIGEQFRTISAKYKPCVLEQCYEENGELMKQNKAESVVKVWCKRKYLPYIEHTLRIKAQKIQDFNSGRDKAKRIWLNHRMAILNDTPPKSASDEDLLRVKQNRITSFEKKQHASNSNKSKTLHIAKHRKTSVKCYNCQIEQSRLPHKCDAGIGIGNDGDRSNACVYHPGYKDNGGASWSCCGQDVSDAYETVIKQHSDNGCVHGPHQWRYLHHNSLHHTKTRPIAGVF